VHAGLTLEEEPRSFLKNASKDVANRIQERLQQLSNNPICEEKLKGSLQDLCKTIVGHYRIMYLLKPCSITVVYTDKRESIYDKLRRL